MPSPTPTDPARLARKQIADSTLAVISAGSYTLDGTTYDLSAPTAACVQHTRFYAEDSLLSRWATWRPTAAPRRTGRGTHVALLEVSTLVAARMLAAAPLAPPPSAPSAPPSPPRIALLNFASATKPGGGFLSGAQAQEESLARASTLHPSLASEPAQHFYAAHARPGGRRAGFYSHAMVYSPGVVVFRDDAGGWAEPLAVDVLTSAAVNAGVVRARVEGAPGEVEARIEAAMRERMGRVLALLESRRAAQVVLGAFGTGVFQNDVGAVAEIWADLLLGPGARFGGAFERVVFAIVGRGTYEGFEKVFERRASEGRGFAVVHKTL